MNVQLSADCTRALKRDSIGDYYACLLGCLLAGTAPSRELGHPVVEDDVDALVADETAWLCTCTVLGSYRSPLGIPYRIWNKSGFGSKGVCGGPFPSIPYIIDAYNAINSVHILVNSIVHFQANQKVFIFMIFRASGNVKDLLKP